LPPFRVHFAQTSQHNTPQPICDRLCLGPLPPIARYTHRWSVQFAHYDRFSCGPLCLASFLLTFSETRRSNGRHLYIYRLQLHKITAAPFQVVWQQTCFRISRHSGIQNSGMATHHFSLIHGQRISPGPLVFVSVQAHSYLESLATATTIKTVSASCKPNTKRK